MKADAHPGIDDSVDLSGLGLRPITRWVPRTRDEDFMRSYREQRGIIAASVRAADDESFWERTQTREGWT